MYAHFKLVVRVHFLRSSCLSIHLLFPFHLMLEDIWICCPHIEQLFRSFKIEAELGNWNNHQRECEHQNFNDTAKIFRQHQEIVYVTFVLHSLGMNEQVECNEALICFSSHLVLLNSAHLVECVVNTW